MAIEALYRLDGNGNDSVNGYNMSSDTPPVYTLGIKNTSGQFTKASGNHFVYQNTSNLAIGTSDWYINLWWQSTGTQGNLFSTILSKGASGRTYDYYLCVGSDHKLKFGIMFSGASKEVSADFTAYEDGKWHMITAIAKRDDSMYLFVDGKQVGTPISISSLASQNVTSTYYTWIGAQGNYVSWQTPNTDTIITGKIDNVLINRGYLSQAKTKNYYLHQKGFFA